MNNEAKEIWDQMLSVMETELSILDYDVWIKPIEPLCIRDGKLVLLTASEWAKSIVRGRYAPLIKAAMNSANDLLTDVEIISKDEKDRYFEAEEKFEIKEQPIVQNEPMSVNPRYNFENFVVGKSNQLAVAAARAVADEPGLRYNPLFIYGRAGLGKTHLMHAIGNSLRVSHPHLKVLLVSSEKFVNELVKHIGVKGGGGSAFRDKYRSADVLMVDDIQFISGKTATTEEIFHTFNELYDANKQLVFTSDRAPKDIPDIDERLRSRFEWGFTADIQPPDLETRIAILRKKAQIQKYNISMEVLAYMAECISSNVREMEGLLNKVILLSQLNETQPSIEMCKEALKDYSQKNDGEVTADDIIDATCKCFSVKREDLIGKRKTREIVEPRQICIYVITELLDLPLSTIGNMFGGRDHTTIMYARDKVAQSLSDSRVKDNVDNIKNMVYKK